MFYSHLSYVEMTADVAILPCWWASLSGPFFECWIDLANKVSDDEMGNGSSLLLHNHPPNAEAYYEQVPGWSSQQACEAAERRATA